MLRALSDLDRGTIVVLPSATFPEAELRKIVGIQHYEERLLCTTLRLANPEQRIVYITSLPLDEAIIEYYLRHRAERERDCDKHQEPGPMDSRNCEYGWLHGLPSDGRQGHARNP